jgi:hypothetical protein
MRKGLLAICLILLISLAALVPSCAPGGGDGGGGAVLDHFKCYNVTGAPSQPRNVHLKDQFIELDATVTNAMLFCNPTKKVYYGNVTKISNPDHHLTLYSLNHTEYGRYWDVNVSNQFGTQLLTVGGPVALAVPTQKLAPGNHSQPVGLDHFLVYQVVNQVSIEDYVDLKDEFGSDDHAGVGEAVYFANPVQKTLGTEVTNITHPDDHLLFYKLYDTQATAPGVNIENQFGEGDFDIVGPAALLGVPSEKISSGEQLDHFLAYGVPEWLEYVGEEVSLKDQFVNITVNVEWTLEFVNPAAKTLTYVFPPIVHPDYHLTVYGFNYTPTHNWSVQVENQFTSGPQWLNLWGPVALAVPTQKLVPGNHSQPVGLDHFLVYLVAPGPYLETPASVKDEFCPPEGEPVTVWSPIELFVPVQKTVVDTGEVTPIKNPLTHLLFYEITGAQVSKDWVLTQNQFLAQNLTLLGEPANKLGVPTLKLDFYELPG